MIMIDEKKIKQAAIECADEYYSLDFGKDREETNREIFVRGAHWAINEFLKDLWHDASEKPVISEHGMILVELNDITACKYSLWRSTTTYESLCNNAGYVHRWLYIDDLLPKKGGAE